jgi:hypothetical protein
MIQARGRFCGGRKEARRWYDISCIIPIVLNLRWRVSSYIVNIVAAATSLIRQVTPSIWMYFAGERSSCHPSIGGLVLQGRFYLYERHRTVSIRVPAVLVRTRSGSTSFGFC